MTRREKQLRRIDGLVAEKILGYRRWRRQWMRRPGAKGRWEPVGLPYFTLQLETAMPVIEEMGKRGYYVNLFWMPGASEAALRRPDGLRNAGEGRAVGMGHAICLAALRAVGAIPHE